MSEFLPLAAFGYSQRFFDLFRRDFHFSDCFEELSWIARVLSVTRNDLNALAVDTRLLRGWNLDTAETHSLGGLLLVVVRVVKVVSPTWCRHDQLRFCGVRDSIVILRKTISRRLRSGIVAAAS